MLKHALLLPALVPALLIGGCMGTENRGLESIHQPVVSRQDFVLDVATSGGGLAPGEQRRLGGWLSTMRLGYGDKVSIDDPVNSRGVAADVAQVVEGYGLLLSGDRPVTGALVQPGTARVVVSRMKASVPGCPDWSRNSSAEFDSNTSSNFGCASNASLAAMIAEPEDLVHGHSATGGDSGRSSRAIDSYRKGSSAGTGAAAVTGSAATTPTAGGGH